MLLLFQDIVISHERVFERQTFGVTADIPKLGKHITVQPYPFHWISDAHRVSRTKKGLEHRPNYYSNNSCRVFTNSGTTYPFYSNTNDVHTIPKP
jgi:hypothetical protein